MDGHPALLRDLEVACDRYPEGTRWLCDFLDRLETNFLDTFKYLREEEQLVRLSSKNEYLLVQDFGRSDVAFQIFCDPDTTTVVHLAVLGGRLPLLVNVVYDIVKPIPSPTLAPEMTCRVPRYPNESETCHEEAQPQSAGAAFKNHDCWWGFH